MTRPRDDSPPLPLDEGHGERVGRPPGNSADSGKTGGQSQGGRIGNDNAPGDGAGVNAQTGKTSGTETEQDSPGMSTEKKGDDTK